MVIVPFGMCWGVDLTASLVLIMGTESYDGREHKYVDYPVTDLLHMTGLASRYVVLHCTVLRHCSTELSIFHFAISGNRFVLSSPV